MHGELISTASTTGVSAVVTTICERRLHSIVRVQGGGYEARKPHVQGSECGAVDLASTKHHMVFLMHFVELSLMEAVRIEESPEVTGMKIIPIG